MTLSVTPPPEIVRRASVHIGEHGELVLSFVAVFSRFEYALKRCLMLQNRTEMADAKPKWEELSASPGFEERFQRQTLSQKAAIGALLRERPHKQVVKAGASDWHSPTYPYPEGSSLLVLQLVRNVRNNLFHGGKFPMRPVDGSERNAELIAGSLVILDHALDCSPEGVRNAFDET